MTSVDQAAPELMTEYPERRTVTWINGDGREVGRCEYLRADLAAPSAPAEVEGLVERLTIWPATTSKNDDALSSSYVSTTMAEAADALTALQAENERLREELSAEKEMLEQSFQSAEELSVLLAKANKRAEKAEADRDALTGAAKDVLAERQRQITAEGWTPEHDDTYQAGDLANAAACYAMTDPVIDPDRPAPVVWPWSASWWKPTDRRRDLVKAGALILAEIELIDRAKLKGDV